MPVESLEASREELTTVQSLPEIAVFRRVRFTSCAEHAVVLSPNLIQAIAHGLLEVFVGVENLTFQVKGNRSHRATDGLNHAALLLLTDHLSSNVGGQLQHAFDATIGASDRVVAGFEPDLQALLITPQETFTYVLATSQALPELTIVGTRLVIRKTENTMVLSDDLLQSVAHGGKKVLIGTYDGAIGFKFNCCRRTVNGHGPCFCGLKLLQSLSQGLLDCLVEH